MSQPGVYTINCKESIERKEDIENSEFVEQIQDAVLDNGEIVDVYFTEGKAENYNQETYKINIKYNINPGCAEHEVRAEISELVKKYDVYN